MAGIVYGLLKDGHNMTGATTQPAPHLQYGRACGSLCSASMKKEQLQKGAYFEHRKGSPCG
jgi:hypothetical protein